MTKKEGEVLNIMSNYFTEKTKRIYLKQYAIKPLTTSAEYHKHFQKVFRGLS